MSVPYEVLPIEQHLSSIRFIAPSRSIIPTTDPNLWGLFVGIGGSREFLGILTTEELIASFRDDWVAAVTSRNKPRPVRVPSVSTADLDDILADLTIDL